MATPKITGTNGRPAAQLRPSAIAPASVIPSQDVESDMYRLWHQNRKWLTALGCPDQQPLIEGGHYRWSDSDSTLAIAHSVPGLRRLQWAVAGNGDLESRYASFELPNGKIASLDLQRGTDLWVTISNFEEEETKKLAGWIDACRFSELQWIIAGAA